MTNTTPAAQSTLSSAVQPFRVRTSCGHIVTRHMRAETARAGGGTGDPTVDIIEAPGGLPCDPCASVRAHTPRCASSCDWCAATTRLEKALVEPEKPAAAPAPTAFIVRRVSLDGAVYTSDPRSEANARAWAAVVLRDDPSAAVSVVPVVPASAATGFRVVRRGPGAAEKDYGSFEARGVADRVAHTASAKHPTAEVSVEPLRSAS